MLNAIQTAIIGFLACMTGPQDMRHPNCCVETTAVSVNVMNDRGLSWNTGWQQKSRWVCIANPQCLYYDTDCDGDVDLLDFANWTNHWSANPNYPDRVSLLQEIEELRREVDRLTYVVRLLVE